MGAQNFQFDTIGGWKECQTSDAWSEFLRPKNHSLLWAIERFTCVPVRCLFRVAVCHGHTEERLGFFRRLNLEGLFRLRGIVIAPQPDHLGRKFRRTVSCIISS